LDLRKKILSLRDKLPAWQAAKYSQKIIQNLRRLEEYKSCRLPLFFYSFRSEVDTRAEIERRIRARKHVALPKTNIPYKKLECFLITSLGQLKPGAFSIQEPDPSLCQKIHSEQIDLVMVPGSVFDRRGARFGYGGGFYDRFLSHDAPQAIRIGLAFSFQVLDNDIPVAPHDQFMDYIITENEIISCHE